VKVDEHFVGVNEITFRINLYRTNV